MEVDPKLQSRFQIVGNDYNTEEFMSQTTQNQTITVFKRTGNLQVPIVFPWSLTPDEVLRRLEVTKREGLADSEVEGRRNHYGSNLLRKAKIKSALRILSEQFKNLIVALLLLAATLSFGFGDWVEGGAVVAVILLNATVGFFTEFKAVRSMEALHHLTKLTVKVRRDGELKEIPAEQLVPGDVVTFQGGDSVSADLRVIQASNLEANESAITGESVPAQKTLDTLAQGVLLADRTNILFKGTTISRGSGEGIVVATGMKTELGRISSLVEKAVEERTPLEKHLDELGRRLVVLTVAITGIVIGAGLLGGKDLFTMIKTAIALAVAAIPEGLTIVATIALARGMWRMAKRNALINRLSAVETLGATSVILTDKTGTLTENQMNVVCLVLPTGEVDVKTNVFADKNLLVRVAVEIGVLCNNASLAKAKDANHGGGVGDPTEIAFLSLGMRAGISRFDLLDQRPEIREEAFDSDTNMMATFHKASGRIQVAVKGATKKVLDSCSKIMTEQGELALDDEDRKKWIRLGNDLGERGLRTLSLATKTVDSEGSSPYRDLTFVGLAGLVDPPRGDVREAILQCQKAGIRVVMVTGDHKATALNVAQEVGLTSDEHRIVIEAKDLDLSSSGDKEQILRAAVFSRVSPKQKLELVSLYQKSGYVVAMTGDGVNDAPALKKADIGIAMGKRGTQVSREAADMVLRDDSFSSIVASIEQGRVIFNNIRKFVAYLLSCNISEILVVTIAAVAHAPLPLLPLQILFLNLVTDVFPALALGVGEGDPSIMLQPPRSGKEALVTRSLWIKIGLYGLLITASVLGAFFLAMHVRGIGPERAVTVSFLTLGFAQLWHVVNFRDRNSRLFVNDITRNPFVWGALLLCAFLMLLTVYFRPLGDVLKIIDPGLQGWLLILTASLIPLVIGQISILVTDTKVQE